MNPNKSRLSLVDFSFIAKMANSLQLGLEDKPERTPDGWKELAWTPKLENEYCDALLRHYKDFRLAKTTAEKSFHLAGISNNAMIIDYHTSKHGILPEHHRRIPVANFEHLATVSGVPKGYYRASSEHKVWHLYWNEYASACGVSALYPDSRAGWIPGNTESIKDKAFEVCINCFKQGQKIAKEAKNDE